MAINIPMNTSTKLDMDINIECFDQKTYRRMIDSLLYLILTRLDIMFSIGLCTRLLKVVLRSLPNQ